LAAKMTADIVSLCSMNLTRAALSAS